MPATTDTKSLFVTLIKKWNCDLVMDIGSRDGKQSILFKDALPGTKVVAFEANPKNYERMTREPGLRDGIVVVPLAVSDKNGTATFHIAAAEYDKPETAENNLGVSSLLVHPEIKTAASVEVETVRLDTFLRKPEYDGCQRVALRIDVESAEYWVLEGMREVVDRINIIHVETAITEVRIGQRTYDELSRLLKSLNFTEIGSNIEEQGCWGDVVYVQDRLLPEVRGAKLKAKINSVMKVNHLAAFLKEHCPALYRTLRKWFVRTV